MSSGPGSYTGLRIGLSTAKGVAYARNVPLIAVPTLQLITVGPLLYDDDMPDDALLVPMIDARRMEVYAAVYDRALHTVREVGADIVTADTYREWLDRAPVYFMGDGAEKCKAVDRSTPMPVLSTTCIRWRATWLRSPNAPFSKDVSWMWPISRPFYSQGISNVFAQKTVLTRSVSMEYNTQKAPVRMKAYGREVQLMVEHALTLSDRAERTAYAARIVDTMRIVSRQPADSREVNEKLWNHLAQLTDYALDIDWPVEVDRAPAAAQAERLTYPTHRLRFRHYGHLLQTWMNRIADEPDAEVRARQLCDLAARMQLNLAEMRGGATEIERLAKDIDFCTEGRIPSAEVMRALQPS